MPLRSGSRILVCYEGFDTYHERLLLGHVKESQYFALTPDGDVYVEDYGEENDNISSVRIMVDDTIPPDLRRARLHRFTRPVPVERLEALRAEAEMMQLLHGHQEGAPAGGRGHLAGGRVLGGAAPALLPAAAVGAAAGAAGALDPPELPLVLAGAARPAVPGGGVVALPGGALAAGGGLPVAKMDSFRAGWTWRCAEVGLAGRVLGEKVSEASVADWKLDVLRPKVVVNWDGSPTFVELIEDTQYEEWKNRRAPLDARIMRVRTLQGKRFREIKDAAADMAEVTFDDWPLKGPRTAGWCITFLASQPGGAAEHHLLWRRAANLAVTDFGVIEHEAIMECIRQAVNYDQYDLSNSASFEVLVRRAQTIEYSHMERTREGFGSQNKPTAGFGGLTYEEQEAFAGTARSSVLMIAPSLLEFVKTDVARHSELMKSIIKSREYRAELQKKK